MHSRVSVLFLLTVGAALAGAADSGWVRLLDSVGLKDDPNITVSPVGEAAASDWHAKVGGGAVLILEGQSPLASSFGFVPKPQSLAITNIEDVHDITMRIVLEAPVRVSWYDVPKDATVFSVERWTRAPVVAGMRFGKGAVLWSAMGPGPKGYERLPYLVHALADLGVRSPYRSHRLWAFFDYSYRTRADPGYLARKWRIAGIGAIHAAAWHFYDTNAERDTYLRELIDSCHREGILVYAWLELPHVSDRFWDDHPEWREKTAVLQDAQLDWRKLMNLANRECFLAVSAGVKDLIRRYDWDGVNFAELYYESLEGASNPSRFTPMNPEVRAQFQASPGGFDPIEIWTKRRDAASLRRFLNFRADLARKLQEEWLAEAEGYRSRKPDLDIVLTHVDDRFDAGMRDAIGADAARVLPLMDRSDFTFLIEDPATVWNLGPERYPEIAKRYQPLTKHTERLAIDINVVERYQDVYPTKQQTGGELYQLLHLASESFSRVMIYFENSIRPQDMAFISAAMANPRGLGIAQTEPPVLDGQVWPVHGLDTVWLPTSIGHRLTKGVREAPVRILDFSGEILEAVAGSQATDLLYTSESRAIARFPAAPAGVRVDGNPFEPRMLSSGGTVSMFLPRGRHRVTFFLDAAPPTQATSARSNIAEGNE